MGGLIVSVVAEKPISLTQAAESKMSTNQGLSSSSSNVELDKKPLEKKTNSNLNLDDIKQALESKDKESLEKLLNGNGQNAEKLMDRYQSGRDTSRNIRVTIVGAGNKQTVQLVTVS